MRKIETKQITQTVRELCIRANHMLSQDMVQCIQCSAAAESDVRAKQILENMQQNLDAAQSLHVPICQDTGMAVVYVEVGQEVCLVGQPLRQAVEQGIRLGYRDGYLRKSVVADPLRRVNTNDNTPGIIYTEIVPGDRVTITVAPKGFGSENMSALRMMTPAAGREEVIQFIVDTVATAGGNPCPPMVVGVGIGGTFEYAAYLAKKALLRSAGMPNQDPYYAEIERECLEKINALGIGPQGFGGDTTALCVHIEPYATHIAGLPVAVNIGCHVTRHQQAIL